MKSPPRRITVHLRPVIRRLTALWMATIVLEAAMTVSMAYHARAVMGACWLALTAVFAYALTLLKSLRLLAAVGKLDGDRATVGKRGNDRAAAEPGYPRQRGAGRVSGAPGRNARSAASSSSASWSAVPSAARTVTITIYARVQNGFDL